MTALAREPLTFVDIDGWLTPDERGRVVLSDVAPGAYRLRVLDWLGARFYDEGVLAGRDITVPPSMPLEIALGAGSVTGRLVRRDGEQNEGGEIWKQDMSRFGVEGDIRFSGPATVIALPREASGQVRRTREDGKGNFCL